MGEYDYGTGDPNMESQTDNTRRGLSQRGETYGN